MSDSIMLEKSKDFAVRIITLCKKIRASEKEFILTNQLLRSATSIGANIHESKYAQSTADFISKMKIALKECFETEYWLELLTRSNYIRKEQYESLRNECGTIRHMLISSINTSQKNQEK